MEPPKKEGLACHLPLTVKIWHNLPFSTSLERRERRNQAYRGKRSK